MTSRWRWARTADSLSKIFIYKPKQSFCDSTFGNFCNIGQKKTMASASSSSARHLFGDSKKRLCDRVGVNVNNLGSVARQVVRGSKSNEILGQTIKNFTQVDIVSDYSSQNLHKMQLILQHVDYQHEIMLDSVNHMDYLKDQVTAMER